MNQIVPSAFKRMTYVGKEGDVSSVVHSITYGTRKAGEEMFVHASDLQSSPTLWVETPDYVPPKKRKQKVEEDAIE